MATAELKAPPQLGRLSLVTADSLATQLPHTLSEASLLLREDDSLLRQTFFEVVYHHHPHLADKIDEIYKLSLAWCNTESDKDFQALEKILSGLNPDELILVRHLLSSLGVALMLASAPSLVKYHVECVAGCVGLAYKFCSRSAVLLGLQYTPIWDIYLGQINTFMLCGRCPVVSLSFSTCTTYPRRSAALSWSVLCALAR